MLALTGIYALLQQAFNLFYTIDDILVYYIPLYLIGAIWTGFASNTLGNGAWGTQAAPSQIQTPDLRPVPSPAVFYWFFFSSCCRCASLAPISPIRSIERYDGAPDVEDDSRCPTASRRDPDQQRSQRDRAAFLLTSGREAGDHHHGSIPLLAPDARFTDIGSTIETGLMAMAALSI